MHTRLDNNMGNIEMNNQPQLIIIVPLIVFYVVSVAIYKLVTWGTIQLLDFANYLINYSNTPYLIYKQRNTINKEELYML